MSGRMMIVLVNERSQSVPFGITVEKLRDQVKPDADLLMINSFPSRPDTNLKEGDKVVLIRRGKIPKADELEAVMVARHTPGVHARMKESTVGIGGLGGLGSTVAMALTRLGIGTLILADFDLVESSNLNRQQYAIKHIGMAKTDAMAQILESINPYLQVVSHNVILGRKNIPELFQTADVIVECLDLAESKAMFIQTIAEFLPETYVIGASGLAGYGDSNSIQTIRLGEKIFMVGDLVKGVESGRGVMAPRVGIAAHHQANLVASLLMDSEDLKL